MSNHQAQNEVGDMAIPQRAFFWSCPMFFIAPDIVPNILDDIAKRKRRRA